MALLYKYNESRTANVRIVTRPGTWRISLTMAIASTRLTTYLLIARVVGVQEFGLFLLMQWLAYAPLPLFGIGIDPVARRRIVNLQVLEPVYGAARIFRFLLTQQCYRVLYYYLLYIPLCWLLTFASKGLLPFPLLLLAGLAVSPLLMSSVIGITLQSQGRNRLLAVLSMLHALLTLLCVLAVPLLQASVHMELLLLVPTLVNIVTLIIAAVSLAQLIPHRDVLPIGPLFRQKLTQAASVSPLHFCTDVLTWRELPLLTAFMLNWHAHASLLTITCYAFSLLLCTRLVEVAPTCFITCLLPLYTHLSQHFKNRPFAHDTYDSFIQTTCYVLLLSIVLCTLLTLFCPQLVLLALGPAYLPMVTTLRILLVAVVFSSCATVSLTHVERIARLIEQHQPVHQVYRLIRNHHYLRLGTAIAYIVLIIPGITLWGILGVAIASTLVRIGFALSSMILCRRLLRTNLNLPSRLPIAS